MNHPVVKMAQTLQDASLTFQSLRARTTVSVPGISQVVKTDATLIVRVLVIVKIPRDIIAIVTIVAVMILHAVCAFIAAAVDLRRLLHRNQTRLELYYGIILNLLSLSGLEGSRCRT